MFVSNRSTLNHGFDIAQVDAEGFGKPACLRLFSGGHAADMPLAEQATRLLVVALNMDGGIERALSALRAETVRQRQ